MHAEVTRVAITVKGKADISAEVQCWGEVPGCARSKEAPGSTITEGGEIFGEGVLDLIPA